MPQDNQETDWIEWQGGECPVAEPVRVDIRYRDGTEERGHAAGDLSDVGGFNWWRHEGSVYAKHPFGFGHSDIIAYRVVQA